jgi:hypothetical protein
MTDSTKIDNHNSESSHAKRTAKEPWQHTEYYQIPHQFGENLTKYGKNAILRMFLLHALDLGDKTGRARQPLESPAKIGTRSFETGYHSQSSR